MDRESIKKLKVDRRLIDRRGWISKADLDKELESLPDTSDKIAPPDEESNEGALPE